MGHSTASLLAGSRSRRVGWWGRPARAAAKERRACLEQAREPTQRGRTPWRRPTSTRCDEGETSITPNGAAQTMTERTSAPGSGRARGCLTVSPSTIALPLWKANDAAENLHRRTMWLRDVSNRNFLRLLRSRRRGHQAIAGAPLLAPMLPKQPRPRHGQKWYPIASTRVCYVKICRKEPRARTVVIVEHTPLASVAAG
jgi:hypothetical protein